MFERFEASNRQEREEMAAQLLELYRTIRDLDYETRAAGTFARRLDRVTAAKARLNTIELVFDILGIDYSQF